MGAVLENVAGWHGGIAEAVDEDGLELALQEMDAEQEAHQFLDIGRLGQRLVKVVVNKRPKRVEEEGRDQKRTEIFNDEHGSPCDLRTCSCANEAKWSETTHSLYWSRGVHQLTKVFDLENALVLQPSSRHCGALLVGNHAAVARLGDPQTVDREAGCSCQLVIDLLSRGIGIDLDFFGESLDGFSYTLSISHFAAYP